MGEKIHALRLYLGLSLQAFGESLGYTGRHISRFEKNVVEPDERVIQRICEVFHVEPSYFTGALSVEQSVSVTSQFSGISVIQFSPSKA